MTRIIALAMPKGGVGKSTTTENLGAALAEQGQRVLLIDNDPGNSLSRALGFDLDESEPSLYTVLDKFLKTFDSDLISVIRQTGAGVDLVPANPLLYLADEDLAKAYQREFVLRRLIEPVASTYDFILIDNMPYLGALVVNALGAANEVLLPIQAETLGLVSVKLILREIKKVQRSGVNPQLRILGGVITMLDERLVINRNAAEHARQVFGKEFRIFETAIKRRVAFTESQGMGKSVLQYEPKGDSAMYYRALAREVLNA